MSILRPILRRPQLSIINFKDPLKVFHHPGDQSFQLETLMSLLRPIFRTPQLSIRIFEDLLRSSIILHLPQNCPKVCLCFYQNFLQLRILSIWGLSLRISLGAPKLSIIQFEDYPKAFPWEPKAVLKPKSQNLKKPWEKPKKTKKTKKTKPQTLLNPNPKPWEPKAVLKPKSQNLKNPEKNQKKQKKQNPKHSWPPNPKTSKTPRKTKKNKKNKKNKSRSGV